MGSQHLEVLLKICVGKRIRNTFVKFLTNRNGVIPSIMKKIALFLGVDVLVTKSDCWRTLRSWYWMSLCIERSCLRKTSVLWCRRQLTSFWTCERTQWGKNGIISSNNVPNCVKNLFQVSFKKIYEWNEVWIGMSFTKNVYRGCSNGLMEHFLRHVKTSLRICWVLWGHTFDSLIRIICSSQLTSTVVNKSNLTVATTFTIISVQLFLSIGMKF